MTGPPGEREGASLSVVIPTLDEASTIRATLARARDVLGPEAELVVADGGSRDGTRAAAAGLARVVAGPRGRGPQLNAGARAARGEILVFLHADTWLEPGAGEAIAEALDRPGVACGCFRFGVRPPPEGIGRYRLLELGVRLRTRLFRTATGDHGLFVRRETFARVGGFPEWPLFEDVGFLRRLRRVGTFQPVPTVARTSRRGWERRGFWHTVLLHWGLRAAYTVGVPPARLARWYGLRVEGEEAASSHAGPGESDPSRPPDELPRGGGPPRPGGGPDGSPGGGRERLSAPGG